MIERLPRRHVVLLGIGHTHAHLVRMWKMHAPPDTALTCLSDHAIATYSGLLPAVLAGQFAPAAMEIDLVRLCASAGARLLTEPVTGIDAQGRQVLFADRPPVAFDVLSIGIGSTSSFAGLTVDGQTLVAIKPMQSFLDRLRAALVSGDRGAANRDLRVVVVGGGVAGIEIAACLPPFVAAHARRPLSLHIVTRSDTVLPGLVPRARRMIVGQLQRRGVRFTTGQAVDRVTPAAVILRDGTAIDADVVVWVAGAAPPPLIGKLGLALDSRGFIATDATLQTTSAANVFAVGDSGSILGENIAKAGVYAVRQGPVLWRNVIAALEGRPLHEYKPQRSFLKLINLGDGRAVGQWKQLAMQGRGLLRLKHRIDTRFMDLYQVDAMSGSAAGAGDLPAAALMQCRGCGCKVGSDVLRLALDPDGAADLDDAAEVGQEQPPLVASTDFFSNPVDDPYLAGRIAALHAASDIFASGAMPSEALANVVLPEGDPAAQRLALRDFLSGARREFDAMGAKIVGGHTIVGPRMEIGFTVIGRALGDRLIRKRGLRPGDHLLLTKPLGIGVLLAAQQRAACPAAAMQGLMAAMLQPQHELARLAVELGIVGGTDVTGFALAGHLLEMLYASRVSAELHMAAIPTLPGVKELIAAGMESSLAPDNRRAETSIDATAEVRSSPLYPMLFDPQTCGGLLLAVNDEQRERFVAGVTAIGLPEPAWIACVHPATAGRPLKIV
jgi:selenide,water dikinase